MAFPGASSVFLDPTKVVAGQGYVSQPGDVAGQIIGQAATLLLGIGRTLVFEATVPTGKQFDLLFVDDPGTRHYVQVTIQNEVDNQRATLAHRYDTDSSVSQSLAGAGDQFRVAVAYTATGLSMSANGKDAVSLAIDTVPDVVRVMLNGRAVVDVLTATMASVLKFVHGYPTPKSNAELKTLSAVPAPPTTTGIVARNGASILSRDGALIVAREIVSDGLLARDGSNLLARDGSTILPR